MDKATSANTKDDTDGRALLSVAREAIEYGLQQQRLQLPDAADYPPAWRERYASFVTLKLNGGLRGCVGTTDAVEALVIGVARNAYNAAFHDPRFKPLSTAEYPRIHVSLSLLTPAQKIVYSNEAQLLAELVPGKDGLIIEHGRQRATFLPSVWESLPQPRQFLYTLKHKAGLPPDCLPERAWRYRCECYGEPA